MAKASLKVWMVYMMVAVLVLAVCTVTATAEEEAAPEHPKLQKQESIIDKVMAAAAEIGAGAAASSSHQSAAVAREKVVAYLKDAYDKYLGGKKEEL